MITVGKILMLDLYVRVTGIKIKGRDFMYSTDELNESGVWCGSDYKDGYGSHQIGDNWEEFPMTDLAVRYCDGYSGTAWHGKYLYHYLSSDRSKSAWSDDIGGAENSPFPWYCGSSYVSPFNGPTYVNSNWGWRPCLWIRS